MTGRWQEPRTLRRQWAGVLLGPVAWGLHLQASYALAAFVCDDPWRHGVHALSIVAIGMALAGSFVGWRNLGDVRRAAGAGDRLERSDFMSVSGVVLGAFFALVIVAQWIPTLFLDPCQY